VIIMPVNLAATDPFPLLSEDWFSAAGSDWHPHRGLETVTLVVDGVLEHLEHMLPGRNRGLITLAAGGDRESAVMACSAQPIGQPVAMGGPFVMNTKTGITHAFNDFHSGKFGDIPRQARLKHR
jgi:redox-sensitive bicupin YhaK (pirin superfamily)